MGAEDKETPRSTRGDQAAKAWAVDRAGEFGRVVSALRAKLQLSAVELSNRTREIGYPITRSTIAKIESNSRNGKFDVAEVMVLAAALEVSPAHLLFPSYPDGGVRAVPRDNMTGQEAWDWMTNADDFNQWNGLHRPRLTLTRQLFEAIRDFRDAVSAFEMTYRPERIGRAGSWILRDAPNYLTDRETLEVNARGKDVLAEEYRKIEELSARVQTLGGHVKLPEWLGVVEKTPF